MKLRVILCVVALLAGYLAGRWQPASVQAQSAKYVNVTVPKTWGSFRAVYNDQLLFEDDHGTIRSVYPNGSVVVFVVTRR